LKHIAVRLKRFSDSEVAFRYHESHEHKRHLVDANIEKRDPALRNFTEGLLENGLSHIVDGCRMYWFQIKDANPLEYYQQMNEVECVFDSDWFEEQKKRIRYYQGAQYVDQCIQLAKQFTIKNQERKIDYVIGKSADKREAVY